MRSNSTLLLAALTAILALPSTAQAGDWVGSNSINGDPVDFFECDSSPAPPCVFVQDAIGGTPVRIPYDGVLTKWTVRAEGAVALRTLRDRAEFDDALSAASIGFTGDVTGDGTVQTRTITPGIPVKKGDYIAVKLGSGAKIAGIFGGAGTLDWEVSDDDNVFSDDSEQLESFSRVYVERPAEEQKPPPPPVVDVYAAIREAGPAVTLGRKAAASKARVVPVAVTNPYAFGLSGSVALKATRKGKAVGKAKFSLGPKGSKAVSVKLSKRAFKKLAKRRKLSLVAEATTRAAVGKARTTTAKLVVKAPPRPKKKPNRKPTPKPGVPKGGDPGLPVTGSLDGKYKGDHSVSFTVSKGRVTQFGGFVPVFCMKVYGNGMSHFDTAGQFFVGQDNPAINTSGVFSGTAALSYRKYTYEGRIGRGGIVTGTLKASYTKSTLDPFPQNAWDMTTYSCTGTQGFTAKKV